MDRLKGEIALLTGAASRIGRGRAEALDGEGARVVSADVDEAAGRESAAIQRDPPFTRSMISSALRRAACRCGPACRSPAVRITLRAPRASSAV